LHPVHTRLLMHVAHRHCVAAVQEEESQPGSIQLAWNMAAQQIGDNIVAAAVLVVAVSQYYHTDQLNYAMAVDAVDVNRNAAVRRRDRCTAHSTHHSADAVSAAYEADTEADSVSRLDHVSNCLCRAIAGGSW